IEVTTAALKQHDAEGSLHLADRMTHCAGCEMQFRSGGLQRIPTTRCLEDAQLGHGHFRQNIRRMSPVRGSHVRLLVGARAAAHNAMPPLWRRSPLGASCLIDGQVELPNALCMISILT